jgi:hypothetical protein
MIKELSAQKARNSRLGIAEIKNNSQNFTLKPVPGCSDFSHGCIQPE